MFLVQLNTSNVSEEGSNLICNSGNLPEDQNKFLQETPVIRKQLDSILKTDKLHEFAAQIAVIKAIFIDEIHGLKLQLEKQENSFEENGETLSDEILY